MSRETSEWVDVKNMPRPPEMLTWFAEMPHADYKVKLAFTYVDGEKFRRLTFPDGSHMYSRMIPVAPIGPSPEARKGWRK